MDELILNGNQNFDSIVGNLKLPQNGPFGSGITWQISDNSTIALDGTITRPLLGEPDKEVSLTAVISKGENEITKDYLAVVKSESMSTKEKIAADYNLLTADMIKNKNIGLDCITSSVNLPTVGLYGSTIQWQSNSWRVNGDTGNINRVEGYQWGDEDVELTATISQSGISQSKKFILTVKNYPPQDWESTFEDSTWLDFDVIRNNNTNSAEITENLNLDLSRSPHGSIIRWESSNPSLVAEDGTVNRPLEGEALQNVTLTAILNRGEETREVQFNLKVKKLTLTDEDRILADRDWLTDWRVSSGNYSLQHVENELNLVKVGRYGSTISWESSNDHVVSTNGAVNRQSYTQGDVQVTLTATISYGQEAQPVQKTFDVIVKAKDINDSEKVTQAKADLTYSKILGRNSSADDIETSLNLMNTGLHDTEIIWSSSNTDAITSNGYVQKPDFGEEDKVVTLTATIKSGNEEAQKTLIVTVKAEYFTDTEIVNDVKDSLTEDLILSEGDSINAVTKNLNLPKEDKYDTSIVWTSTNENVVSTDGVVKVPQLGEGDKDVTLTATISRGDARAQKVFDLTVPAKVPTNLEAVEYVASLLTEKDILNNNISLDNITGDLVLPKEGAYNTSIFWRSSNEEVLLDSYYQSPGKVIRPRFAEGDQEVTLTAIISKGINEVEKSFNLTVKKLKPTDHDAVFAVYSELTYDVILKHNSDRDNIMSDLNLIRQGEYETSITWSSSDEYVISSHGYVVRPGISERDKKVSLSATITRGSAELKKTFTLTVKARIDNSLKLLSSRPYDNEQNVKCNTEQIELYFDRDIKLDKNYNNIQLGYYSDGKFIEEDINVRADGIRLYIDIANDMEFSKIYYVNIPRNAVRDQSGYTIREARSIAFRVEPKKVCNIILMSSAPENGQKDVGEFNQIQMTFPPYSFMKGETFENIKVISALSGEEVPIKKELNVNKVNLTIDQENTLKESDVYNVTIPHGALTDRFKNKNRKINVQFKMRDDLIPPKVKDIYPLDGQKDINIYKKSIDISFSEKVKIYKEWAVKLYDEDGNNIAARLNYDTKTGNNGFYSKFYLEPASELKPNKTYHVSIGRQALKDSADNYMEADYEMSFSTGDNSLAIDNINIKDREQHVAIDTAITIDFSSSVLRGENFNQVKLQDSAGNSVGIKSTETKNRVYLVPDEILKNYEKYTVDIPYGAYKDDSNSVNDEYKMTFTTAYPLGEVYPQGFTMQSINGKEYSEKPITFTAFESTTQYNDNYNIESYTWDFGDGESKKGREATHSFSPGSYEIKLTIRSEGMTKEYKQDLLIIDPDTIVPSETSIDAWTNLPYSSHKWQSSVVASSSNENIDVTNINVNLSYMGIPAPEGEAVSVKLYQNGQVQKTYEDIIIDTNGTGTFSFNYHYLKGNYELEFTYGIIDNHQKDIFPIRVLRGDPKTINVRLQSQRSIYKPEYVDFEINGEVRKVKHKERYSSIYSIRDLPTGEYEIKIADSEDILYSEETKVVNLSKNTDVTMKVHRVPTGDPTIYRTNRSGSFMYIKGVDRTVDFDISGGWHYHPEGYYEVKTPERIIRKKSSNFTLDNNDFGNKSGRVYVRMVSKDGSHSKWKDTGLRVVQYPPVPSNSITYNSNGSYNFSMLAKIDGFTQGKLGFLSKMPFMNFSKSFGMSNSNNYLNGALYRDTLTYRMALNNNKKVSFISAGRKISGSLEAYVQYKYDFQNNQWNLNEGYITMDAYNSTTIKKKLVLCKFKGIKIGPSITTIYTTYVGSEFNFDGKNKTGKLYISPSIDYGIDASIAGFGIEGWGGGRIFTEYHVPTGYLEVSPYMYVKVIAKYFLGESTIFYENVYMSWNNGRQQVASAYLDSNLMASVKMPEELDMKPMSRDYLDYPTTR